MIIPQNKNEDKFKNLTISIFQLISLYEQSINMFNSDVYFPLPISGQISVLAQLMLFNALKSFVEINHIKFAVSIHQLHNSNNV